jgi:hypothetical protein
MLMASAALKIRPIREVCILFSCGSITEVTQPAGKSFAALHFMMRPWKISDQAAILL